MVKPNLEVTHFTLNAQTKSGDRLSLDVECCKEAAEPECIRTASPQRRICCVQRVPHSSMKPRRTCFPPQLWSWKVERAVFHAVALRGRWKEGRSRSGVPQEVRPAVPVTTGQPKPLTPGVCGCSCHWSVLHNACARGCGWRWNVDIGGEGRLVPNISLLILSRMTAVTSAFQSDFTCTAPRT